MADTQRIAARRAFVGQLNELRELAGSPTLSQLRKLSQRAENQHRLLAESTTHDILTGKRERLPEWPWVASFVVACHTAAAVTGLDTEALGSLQEWLTRWRAALPSQRVRGTDTSGGDRPPAVPAPSAPADAAVPADARAVSADVTPGTPAAPAVLTATGSAVPATPVVWTEAAGSRLDRVHVPADPPAPGPGPAPAPPVPPSAPPLTYPPARTPPPMSPLMRRYLTAYGRTGARLLRHAEAGDARSCFLLGIVNLLKEQPFEARQWLWRADKAGHPDALELSAHPSARRQAAKAAYRYGRGYEAEGTDKVGIAMFFYQLASDCDHAEATYQLGSIFYRKGETWQAATCFSRAACQGHPQAATEFNNISEQLSHGWMFPVEKLMRAASSAWAPPPGFP